MATLPHFNTVKAAQNLEEPVYLGLFDIQFQLPPAVNGGEILYQNATGVELPPMPELEMVEQNYKYSKRRYAGLPDGFTHDFDIEFNVNLNDGNSPYVFKTLQDWYKLTFNPATGEVTRKIDHVGTITVDVHTKDGEIIRRVVFKDVEIVSLTDMTLEWGSNEIFSVTGSFRSDHWDDLLV